jgi:hypothetical protein
MKRMKTVNVILAASILGNVAFLFRTTILQAEYSWLRNTYETDIIGAYGNDGRLTATIENSEGRPKEYILDSAPATMGIAVEKFSSHKPNKTGTTNFISRALRRVFDKSYKPEPERIWHAELKNRWLAAYVREHNATLSRLRSEKP